MYQPEEVWKEVKKYIEEDNIDAVREMGKMRWGAALEMVSEIRSVEMAHVIYESMDENTNDIPDLAWFILSCKNCIPAQVHILHLLHQKLEHKTKWNILREIVSRDLTGLMKTLVHPYAKNISIRVLIMRCESNEMLRLIVKCYEDYANDIHAHEDILSILLNSQIENYDLSLFDLHIVYIRNTEILDTIAREYIANKRLQIPLDVYIHLISHISNETAKLLVLGCGNRVY